MLDFNEMQMDYAKSFMDKTRIYFIEKYLSTFDATAGRNVPFRLFPRQKIFLKSISENPASIAIKHRQCGITTISSAWAAAQCVFASKETPECILCIGNKLDLAQQLIVKIRDFLEQVPRWYWGNEYYSPDSKSKINQKSIFVKNSKIELELFNGCKVYARSSSPNAARGISAVSILIFDEAAFIEDGLAVYSSAVAATASNPNRKLIMVSTPNGKDELYYNTYKQAINKENNYNAVEFRWFQDLRYNKFLKWYKKDADSGEMLWDNDEVLDETGTVPYNEERWENLLHDGWKPTSPWYISMCQSFNNDSMKIAQELDVSFMGSANNVVDPEYIEMQSNLNVREPLEDMKDPMVEETWFWKPPIDGHRYIIACLPKGEKVRTQRGLVNVEDVQKSDKLLTKDGKLVNIVHKMRRNVTNEKIVTFRPTNTCRKTTFTWNHPILSSTNTKLKRNGKRYWDFDFRKNNAEDVNIKDWLVVPNTYYLKELSNEEIISKWDKYENETRTDFKIACPLLNEDFWWFCGMWLAEGWTEKDKNGMQSVHTCHNITETDYVKKISNLAKTVFNRKATLTIKEGCHVTTVSFSSKQLSNFMNDNFGKYAKNKYISEWIKFLPKQYKVKLVEGYLQGDGFVHSKEKYSGFTSISLKLLEDVQDILFSLGIIGSIKLHVKEGTIHKFPRCKKWSICSNKYELSLGLYDTKKLLDTFGVENNIKLKNRRIIKDVFFSDDLTKIYFKVAEKEEKTYSGFVYNFWVDDDSHTYTCMNIVCGNCDPSRGTSEDRTAIEVIDMDGRDTNGMPIIEQVMEYVGKKLGDDIGAMMYQYSTMYNNAFIIVDASGGQGDAAILQLLNMGYTNMYYEDSVQKSYTIQNSTKVGVEYTDRLPGFHFQGNRYPVLSNFAGMIRSNEFKVRSRRVIHELETWIFKGETGRIDHMTGSHDDTLTCLAMALFVMQFSVNKMEAAKAKDATILKAYTMGSKYTVKPNRFVGNIEPKNNLPFYTESTLKKNPSRNIQGNYLWVFGKLK